MVLLKKNEDELKMAEKMYAEISEYFHAWKNLPIKTEEELRAKLATSYELETVTCHGRSFNFEYKDTIGSALATDSGLRLSNIITLFVNGVLTTYRIDREGKAQIVTNYTNN